MSFFLGSWDMNRSAEQTNRTRTASRFTRFVCSALRFISHEPRKKDTHSLNNSLVYSTETRPLVIVTSARSGMQIMTSLTVAPLVQPALYYVIDSMIHRCNPA